MQAVVGPERQCLQHQDEAEAADEHADQPQPQETSAALRPVVPQVDDEQRQTHDRQEIEDDQHDVARGREGGIVAGVGGQERDHIRHRVRHSSNLRVRQGHRPRGPCAKGRPSSFGLAVTSTRIQGATQDRLELESGRQGDFLPRNREGGAKRRVGSSGQGFTPSCSAFGRATFPVSGKDQRVIYRSRCLQLESSCGINAIAFNEMEHYVTQKPVPILLHHALSRLSQVC